MLTSQSIAEDANWTLWKDKHQIQIYHSNTPDSPFYTLRAITRLHTSIAAFIALLNDIERVPLWLENADSVTFLSSPGPNESLVHTRFSASWPVKDRDMVTHSRYWQDDDLTLHMEIRDEPDRLPREDAVRITKIQGYWRIRPLDDGSVEITYQLHANPGGRIPVWLGNNLARKSLLSTFKAMRHYLCEDKYQQAQIKNIREAGDTQRNCP